MIRIAVLLLIAANAFAQEKIERVSLDRTRKVPDATTVDSAALVHTGQILPINSEGALAANQVEQIIENLKAVLKASGSSPEQIVRLHVYAKTSGTWEALLNSLIGRKSLGEVLPPIALLERNVPLPDVDIAVDAVAVARDVENVEFVRADTVRTAGGAAAAILPAGPRAYVAGQAEKGATPAEATRKTLESLRNTLKFMGLNNSHVVQCKCFLTPMKARDEVIGEFERCFGKGKVPPLVFVEWKSNLPVEIELIAHAPAPKRKAWDEIDFLTPPGMTASPIYSRVTRVHADKTIYFGNIVSSEKGDGKAEVSSTFAKLGRLLDRTGSDLRHLVKATYYVSNEDCSKALNDQRPNYYDKYRPPSASKAMVADVGIPDRGLSLDMIAVPSSIKKEGKPELGRLLTREQIRDGWISLFDGTTTCGWTGAKVDGAGFLVGGKSTTEFDDVEVTAAIAVAGKVAVGGKVHDARLGIVSLRSGGKKGPIELGADTALGYIWVRPRSFKSIMPGPNLDGWKRIDRANIAEEKRPKWTMKDGILEVTGGPGALEYPTHYGNFVLQVEARSRNRHANGGVFFRSIPGDFMNGYEAQIHSACEKGDPSKPANYATGGIDDRQNARRLVSRDYEWFVMTIIANGPHISTWVNGYQVTDWTDTRKEAENPRQGLRVKPGTIQLQAHDPATDLEFRSIRIVELK